MKEIDLSILICALDERRDTFLGDLFTILEPQVHGRANVEIVLISDDATMPIGTKRNTAITRSVGKYFCFVDDDDRISGDYVERILAEIPKDPDVIVFDAEIRFDGGTPFRVKYSIEHEHWFDIDNATYYRQPNHLMVHKRSTINHTFQDVRWGEDTDWAKKRMFTIKSEIKIDTVLYHYDYSSTTEKHTGPLYIVT